MIENAASFSDISGKRTEVQLDVLDYRAAADAKLSLSQYYAQKYPTAANEATAFEQFCASSGIRLRADVARGIPASSVKELMHGGVDMQAGTIVRDSGANRHSVTGRILFPEVMMQMVNEALIANKEDYLTPWESAIAMRSSVTGPRADQPLINVIAPESSAAQPISQLAEPATMVSITLNERSYAIPTKSIGLQVADQAMQAATIDLVGIALASQARGERIRRIEEDMANIISGDTDFGINAVTFVNASSFDSTIPSPNATITHKAYVKWLRANYQKTTITHLLADIDTALAIDARTGKPVAYTGDQSQVANRFPVDYTIENLGLPSPRLLLLPTSIIGANRIVGFDSRFGLHEITNVSASYSAIENFVLRRSTAMRFDYGVMLVKLYDEAFTGLTLAA
jgi:hypothetical protein